MTVTVTDFTNRRIKKYWFDREFIWFRLGTKLRTGLRTENLGKLIFSILFIKCSDSEIKNYNIEYLRKIIETHRNELIIKTN